MESVADKTMDEQRPKPAGRVKDSTLDPERIPYRGPVFHFFWPYTRYIVTTSFAALAMFFFEVLNRTVIIGRDNVGIGKNTLLLPNHQSMIDGFLVGYALYFPRCLTQPHLFPWLPAAYENFFAHPIMRWFSDNWKCIPVKKGRKDFGAMRRMEACLRNGVMIVFPEGTRTRDGQLLPPRSGIGFVMLKTMPKAVPVCMDGMSRCLPVGKLLPRVFNTIFLYYGKPVDLSEFEGRRLSRENAQAVIEKVFSQVGIMKKRLARYRRYRAHLLAKKPFFYRLFRP